MELINFREMVLEDAGNLKGMPSLFVKELVKGYDSGLGGRNSKIEVFKTNAKQKDVTAATRKVGGWVSSSDKGYSRYSRKELEAQANKEAYAGVAIKIDGEWAFLAQWDDYGDGAAKFKLLTDKGNATVSRWNKGGKYRKGNAYDSPWLKASEISEYIDFKESNVEVYLVTADADRLEKRQERKLAGQMPKISKERKVALQKFLEKKANGLLDELKQGVDLEVDKLINYVDRMFIDSINGKDSEQPYEKILDSIKDRIKDASNLSYHFKRIVKEGTIKDNYRNDFSYNYKKFKEIVDEIDKI